MPTPDFLLRLGLSRQAKVLDLKSRVRCRACGAKGRAVVSVKWGRQSVGEVDCSLRWHRAPRRCPLVERAHRAADQASYRNAAEANKPTASQVTAQSPSNRNNTAVIDTRSDQ